MDPEPAEFQTIRLRNEEPVSAGKQVQPALGDSGATLRQAHAERPQTPAEGPKGPHGELLDDD